MEDYLKDEFIGTREQGGVPIIKDNVEDMFDNWMQDLDVDQWLEWADFYASKKFAEGLLKGEKLANETHNMITNALNIK